MSLRMVAVTRLEPEEPVTLRIVVQVSHPGHAALRSSIFDDWRQPEDLSGWCGAYRGIDDP